MTKWQYKGMKDAMFPKSAIKLRLPQPQVTATLGTS